MSESITCYRFVTDDLRSQNGDEQWVIGEWKKVDDELKMCKVGLHACKTAYQSLKHVYGNRWFKSEARGNIIEGKNKFCSSEMRLIKEIPSHVLDQWMIDCAYHVLPIFEKQYPDDMRPRKLLEAKQMWINNPCKETAKLVGVAGFAAYNATTWEAGAVARAIRAAIAAFNAGYIINTPFWRLADIADSAARDAVVAAAVDNTTEFAEQKWQREHLEELIQETVK